MDSKDGIGVVGNGVGAAEGASEGTAVVGAGEIVGAKVGSPGRTGASTRGQAEPSFFGVGLEYVFHWIVNFPEPHATWGLGTEPVVPDVPVFQQLMSMPPSGITSSKSPTPALFAKSSLGLTIPSPTSYVNALPNVLLSTGRTPPPKMVSKILHTTQHVIAQIAVLMP